MKIAYFTPLNPIRSGISDYNEELLPYLGEHFEIDLFIDEGYTPSNREILEQFSVHTCRELRGERYDGFLYHMGNSPYHVYMYEVLKKHRGITVLHDLNLSHLVLCMLQQKRYPNLWYVWKVYRSHGVRRAASLLWEFACHRRIDPFKHTLNKEVIENSRCVVVHNDFMRRVIKQTHPRTEVVKIPQGIKIITPPSVEEAKRKLGLEGFEAVFASFGLIEFHKRIDVVLKAYRRFLEHCPNSRYVLVGEYNEWYDVRAMIKDMGLQDNVDVTGYVSLETFYEYISAADICINLRYPSAGETSRSLLQLMSFGKPVMISNYNQFTEYPDDCCIKIDIGEKEEDMLLERMIQLYENKSLRESIGRKARECIIKNHSWNNVSKHYVDCINRVFGG
jgi:glycosyltransferase involved in cell wall biosynthesis